MDESKKKKACLEWFEE